MIDKFVGEMDCCNDGVFKYA